MTAEKLIKVAVDLADEDVRLAVAPTELLWAAKTETRFVVEVRNVPFYVRGIAFEDLISIRADHDRREFVYEAVVQPSGRSVLRILDRQGDLSGPLGTLLVAAGCTWEVDSTGLLWAVDVPAECDYGSLLRQLVDMRAEQQIEIQEACTSAVHRSSAHEP